jgi:hypothetical protein
VCGHGCKLKRLLRRAVEAYLDEPTWALAAQRAGIARSTLCRWLKLPAFRQLVDQILRERHLKIGDHSRATSSSASLARPCSVAGCGASPQTGRAVA